MRKKNYLALLALTCILGAALAQQGGQPGPGRSGPDFFISMADEPILDPGFMDDKASATIGAALFEGLMQYDPETNLSVPALADSVRTSEDGLRVSFHLRESRWSDGHPVTAGDFVYAMMRLLDPATESPTAFIPCLILKGAAAFNEGRGSFDEVGIKALDDRTVEYSLLEAAPWFVGMTAGSAFWPLPRWAIEKAGKRWTRPDNIVTNGPYRLKEWLMADYLLLERYQGWRDAPTVALGSIKIFTGRSDKVRWDAYVTGNVDWLLGFPGLWTRSLGGRADYHRAASFATGYILLNRAVPPMDKLSVRKALALAIDRQALMDRALEDGQVATDSLVPPLSGYERQGGSAFDPVSARKLLAEAGYPGGKAFPTLEYLYFWSASNEKAVEFTAAQWRSNLGINVELKAIKDYGAFSAARSSGEGYLALRSGWIGDYLDPDTMLGIFETGDGDNYTRYSNLSIDALLAAARKAAGPERMALLEKAEAILLADVGVIPLFHYANLDMIDTGKWGGWSENPLGIHPLHRIYTKALASTAQGLTELGATAMDPAIAVPPGEPAGRQP
jgi:oligopeptide transport system substrate-binding protein